MVNLAFILRIRWQTLIVIICLAQHPYRHIQVVLRLYQSPAEILAGFDVDCACFLYDGELCIANLPISINANDFRLCR